MIQSGWIESSSITTHSGRTALRRKLGETMLLPALILLIVLSPVLLPAIITAVHLLTGQARPSTQDRVVANFPRRTASRRLAAPAAA
jgi:hypothetical protein